MENYKEHLFKRLVCHYSALSQYTSTTAIYLLPSATCLYDCIMQEHLLNMWYFKAAAFPVGMHFFPPLTQMVSALLRYFRLSQRLSFCSLAMAATTTATQYVSSIYGKDGKK